MVIEEEGHGGERMPADTVDLATMLFAADDPAARAVTTAHAVRFADRQR